MEGVCAASEGLQESDQRALVLIAELWLGAERLLVGAESFLLVELGGAEVVAAIDDEVLALAERHHRRLQVGEALAQLVVARAGGRGGEVELELDEEVADLGDVRSLVAEVVALGAQLEVGKQADRDALGDRAEDDVVAAPHEPRQPAMQG